LLKDVGEQYLQTLFSRATNHDKKSIYKPTLNQHLLKDSDHINLTICDPNHSNNNQ